MANYFRQLTLPWLLTVAVMMLFTGLWYQFESNTQQHILIKQMAASLQVSVEPLLSDNNALVKTQLNRLRYFSAVPLTTVAIFNQHHRLLAASDMPDSLLQFKAPTAVTDYIIQPFEDKLLVLQPLSPVNAPDDAIASASQVDEKYYLLLLFQPENTYTIWLIPISIVGLLGVVVLILLQNNMQQHAQRQYSDVSLISHKLSQMRHGQLDVSLKQDVVPELAPLKLAVNELAQYQADLQAETAQQAKLQQQHIEQIHQQQDALQQQYNQLRQNCSKIEQTIQSRVAGLQQLQQQQSSLNADEFNQALLAQLTLLQAEFGSVTDADGSIRLSELIAEHMVVIRRWLVERQIELHLFEHANNAAFAFQMSAQQLSALLFALIKIACRAPSVTELTLRLALTTATDSSRLLLSITTNGEGMSSRLRQQLNSSDIRALQWYESDIGIFVTLTHQLDAGINIQSLEGLGCTVSLDIPVTGTTPVQTARVKHMLVFDSVAASLSERVQSMDAVAAHIAQCTDLAELKRKSKQSNYDVILIILPQPAELLLWREILHELNGQGQLLCYASPKQWHVWREALQLDVLEAPFCLSHLEKIHVKPTPGPSLLVVDDNPTNLAFVQVLLKEQAIQLCTASCGAEALKLCQQRQFDVILLDIQLPDINGVEVARQLRQLADYQHTPILAFTAHALEQEITEFKRAGMDDVIIKPLEAAKLQQILHWCSIGKTDHSAQ